MAPRGEAGAQVLQVNSRVSSSTGSTSITAHLISFDDLGVPRLRNHGVVEAGGDLGHSQ